MTKAPEGIWGIFDQFGHGSTMLRDLSQNNNILTAGGNEPTKFVRADLYEAQAAEIERLRGELAKAVEEAYAEGFAEGSAGDWIEGDYSKPWAKSQALAELTGGKDE